MLIHSLTAHYAHWYVEQQQRSSTAVRLWPGFLCWSYGLSLPFLTYLQCLQVMMVPLSSCLHCISRSLLEMVCCQKMQSILIRLLVWKVDSFSRSLCINRRHYELYKRVHRTQLWYILSLVCVL